LVIYQESLHDARSTKYEILTSACYNTGNTFRYLYIYCYFNWRTGI